MKKTRLLPLLFLASLVFIYIACQRDDYGSLPTPPTPAEKTQINISGRVLDDENLPVSNAVVKAGNLTANTDLNGNFQLKNVTIDANASFVKVEKTGFFGGSRTFKAIKESTHYVSIQLIKKNDAGSFASAAGGSITVLNGGSINFQPGSVVNAQTNAPYSGNVLVSAALLNPTSDNFLEIMPGELRGIDENDQQVGLQSYGMMVVELTGSGGEHLQLAASKPATLKFPIVPAQQASAPATIAFWSFNDTTGLWKQEGMATRQGNEYIGKASHFSFWNVDAPYRLIEFKAALKDQDDKPVKGVKVVISSADNEPGLSASGYTDSTGVILGFVPADKKLLLSVTTRCGGSLITKEIGPFSGSTDLGNITLSVPAENSISFTGTINNCSGETMQNGYVDIGIDGIYERAPVVNGVLNHTFFRCGSNNTKAMYRITDIGSKVIGDVQEVNIIGNIGSIGTVEVCEGTSEEYLTYSIDTIHRRFVPPFDSVSHVKIGITQYVEYRNGTRNWFLLKFDMDESNLAVIPDYITLQTSDIFYETIGSLNVQITEYGVVGGFISGTFSGIVNNLYQPYPRDATVTGRFKLKRKG